MSITSAELVEYGAASRPQDDTSTVGGAIDAAARPLDTQTAATENLEIVSDGADTRTFTIHYRDAAGDIQTWTSSLNGTTAVALGSSSVERLLDGALGSADGTRTVTLRVAGAGATRHTFNPSETDFFVSMAQSVSAASAKTYYEKTFWKNTNATLSLTSAAVEGTADPDSLFQWGLDTAVDGSTSATNRVTAPTGPSFVDEASSMGVPGGSLAAGSAIGLWRKMSLGASQAAGKTSSTSQLSGQTT